MRIGIVGFGGVGRAFLKLIYDKKCLLEKEGLNIQVNYIIDIYGGVYNKNGLDLPKFIDFLSSERDITKYCDGGKPEEINFEFMLQNSDVDLLVEMTPTNKETGEPGMTHIKRCLEHKINVVTSNKGPILLAYKELYDLAKTNNVQLCIGCTTGGALPTVNGGVMDLAGSNITSIEGVLNGTTNFIIKEMEDTGCLYSEALKKAQESGIAETNPSLDVEGYDTASKLLILTNVLMNTQKSLADISIEGITKVTPEDIKKATSLNKKYKLVGKTEMVSKELKMTVKLEMLDSSSPLYGGEGKNKAVRYVSDTLGELTIIGGASGVTPAAASILRDIVNIHRGYKFIG
ncbi:homoserine dehydrogenase [Sedimentibacter acidaminivorans]|uniref:Homoserine dehydrogenase n=1 Tax=Sedimentibacter acidaminivorans TaxID=913099 RepID=A0ABS4GI26_9FIRM|nr:homoserine dehydrogenase [Sedimentibacter acidaminivorans]MBP1927358.1 homoserine dehydrogenase [Sedimentibacter acidaminivorans]